MHAWTLTGDLHRLSAKLYLSNVLLLALLLPAMPSVTVRRRHGCDRSGGFAFLGSLCLLLPVGSLLSKEG